MRIIDLVESLKSPKILVVGDSMLDCYFHGRASRLNPEASGTVFKVEQQEYMAGGAAAVASMCDRLGADVHIVTSLGVGRDSDMLLVSLGLPSNRVHDFGIADDTTIKIRRVIDGKLLPDRIDIDNRHFRRNSDVNRLACDNAREMIASGDFDIVLLCDHDKGVLQDNGIACGGRSPRTRVFVDPSPAAKFARYGQVDLVKCTLDEARAMFGVKYTPYGTEFSIPAADFIVTHGRYGMWCNGNWSESWPSTNVIDATGAGDMTLACLAVAIGSGLDCFDAHGLAMFAAGLEVERLGAQPISKQELLQAADPSLFKIVTANELGKASRMLRAAGRRVVFTNGCFDLFHAGHLRLLREAKVLGDTLIVAINSDSSVTANKGPGRPILPASKRSSLLAGLDCVDYVIEFDEPTPENLIRTLSPHILVKGSTSGEVVGREIVESYGGQVVVIPATDGESTSAIVERIRST